MNVLILTPDAVGSTLLQRTLTVYMQLHAFDRPVINLHELTNGLVKYYSEDFNQEILGKPPAGSWGYHQSLEEIVETLKSVDHYKTSRLAQYHIRQRQDPIKDQLSFYEYLNENFFIISCRRENLLEHSLSWQINKFTKKLNVYQPQEKIASFIDLYKNKIEVDLQGFKNNLETYKEYVEWCDTHFQVSSYFQYEQHVPDIEKYVLDLPVFAAQPKQLTFKDVYDIEFDDWNRCHRITSDIGSIAMENPAKLETLQSYSQYSLPDDLKQASAQRLEFEIVHDYNQIADPSWPKINSITDYENLPLNIRQECENMHQLDSYKNYSSIKNLVMALPRDEVEFLSTHAEKFVKVNDSIQLMKNLGILVNGIPIKKQTLAEKQVMVKNFDQCIDVYNSWAMQNPSLAKPIDTNQIEKQKQQEKDFWRPGLALENKTPTYQQITSTKE